MNNSGGSRSRAPSSRVYEQGSKLVHFWGSLFRACRCRRPASGSLTSHVVGFICYSGSQRRAALAKASKWTNLKYSNTPGRWTRVQWTRVQFQRIRWQISDLEGDIVRTVARSAIKMPSTRFSDHQQRLPASLSATPQFLRRMRLVAQSIRIDVSTPPVNGRPWLGYSSAVESGPPQAAWTVGFLISYSNSSWFPGTFSWNTFVYRKYISPVLFLFPFPCSIRLMVDNHVVSS